MKSKPTSPHDLICLTNNFSTQKTIYILIFDKTVRRDGMTETSPCNDSVHLYVVYVHCIFFKVVPGIFHGKDDKDLINIYILV